MQKLFHLSRAEIAIAILHDTDMEEKSVTTALVRADNVGMIPRADIQCVANSLLIRSYFAR